MDDKGCERFKSFVDWCTRIGLFLVVLAALTSFWMDGGAGTPPQTVPSGIVAAQPQDMSVSPTAGWLVLVVGVAGLTVGWRLGRRVFAWRFLRRSHVGAVPPWTVLDAARLWIPVLVGVAGHATLRAHLPPMVVGMLLMGGGAVIIPAFGWMVLRARGVGWGALGFGRAWWRGVVQGGWTWLACMPWLLGLNVVLLHVLPMGLRALGMPVEVEAQDAARALWASQANGVVLVLTMVWIVLGAAVLEEILFRGFLQGALKRHMRWQGAVCVSAAVFAAVHLDAVRFLPLFVLGVVLGVVRERTRSLWAAVTMHGLNNLFAVAVLLLR